MLTDNSNHHLDRPPPSLNRRKFSFPASLHSAHLLGGSSGDLNGHHSLASSGLSARRRLSNVSDVVTRKLSSTIGWKSAHVPAQEIITQGKCLCGQYIRSRLIRAGVFNKKLGLQRIRSFVGSPNLNVIRDVFPIISFVRQRTDSSVQVF